jgi:hypothetical protein
MHCLARLGPIALVAIFFCGHASAENWVLFYETPQTAGRSAQSSMYFDRDSLISSKLGGTTYYQVRTKDVRKSDGQARGEEIAVLCEGDAIAPALSTRKMGGILADGKFNVELDLGQLKSVADFNCPKSQTFGYGQPICGRSQSSVRHTEMTGAHSLGVPS